MITLYLNTSFAQGMNSMSTVPLIKLGPGSGFDISREESSQQQWEERFGKEDHFQNGIYTGEL